MTIPSSIVIGGKPFKIHGNIKYEKTTNDYELVAGRVLIKGTADNQAKLFATGGLIIGIGDKQQGNKGKAAATDDNYNDNYCLDGGFCDVIESGKFWFYGCLKDGEVIVKGDDLEAEDGTGKLVKATTGTVVARALESASPSGADKDDFKAKWVYD